MNLLITGVSGHLGQAAVQQLMIQNPFERVFAIDWVSPSRLGPCHFIQADLRRVDLTDIFITCDIHCVLHLACSPHSSAKTTDAEMAEKCLDAAKQSGVKRIIIPSLASVYQANASTADESAPLRRLPKKKTHGGLNKESLAERLGCLAIESKLRLEKMLATYAHEPEDMSIIIPRLAAVLGGQYNQPVEHILSAPAIFGFRKTESCFQFLHIDDAARALMSCTTIPNLSGVYNIAGADVLTLEAVAGILQKPILRLHPALASLSVGTLKRLAILQFGFKDLLRLHLGSAVSTEKSDFVLGKSLYSSRQALALWRTKIPR